MSFNILFLYKLTQDQLANTLQDQLVSMVVNWQAIVRNDNILAYQQVRSKYSFYEF